jgi:VanZ family protein
MDKYVHVFFHFVFTSLWILYLKSQIKNANKYSPLVISFFSSVLLGLMIEVAQELFTTTRSADLFDILANTSGAVLAVCTVLLCERHIAQIKFN